jgi:hypothetical protein
MSLRRPQGGGSEQRGMKERGVAGGAVGAKEERGHGKKIGRRPGWRSFKGGAAGRQRTGSLGCEGATRLCFEQGSAGGR